MNRRFWIRFAPSKTPSALNLGCGEGDDRPGMWIKLLVSAEKQGLTYVIHIPGRSDTRAMGTVTFTMRRAGSVRRSTARMSHVRAPR